MISIKAKNIGLTYNIRQKISLAPNYRKPSPTGGKISATGRKRMVKALEGVNFELNSGDRLGLIGSNGAGKTTLLKVLYGIYEPSEGELSVSGKVDALFNINLGFRQEATGRRNIFLRGLINGWSPKEIESRMDEIIDFSELGGFIDLPFKSYSQGMAARLAFSVATCLEPEILLMDEWIGAGDPAFQQKAKDRMSDLAEKAGIIVLASHNHKLLKTVCNKVICLEEGKVVATGTAEELLD
ncbi:ABC transporter ATP-binding protein [Microbulbifer hydrolyticus]|uniref:ABC-type polysaccharide/polyol phosphate transport system ATPase subunit n=1 Tax=Microbulbifer hydrolyticus TaxID=48074 RepID=A0A6P1T827_9GAMM|nr:ABC transporter ATP-binding protein [Microbulbifer hydrolyticus]MBB5210596.1 ABC-type polysaccharide/polyol phosphate transport system ATPase subunit [Microbulbifer hydrolyticus]QHQ38938.1 ATP-binding cassette domain-containing protein [Microbulbifer hydrolyticus]